MSSSSSSGSAYKDFVSSTPGPGSKIGLGLAILNLIVVGAVLVFIGVIGTNAKVPAPLKALGTTIFAVLLLLSAGNVYLAYRFPVWGRVQILLLALQWSVALLKGPSK